MYDTKQWMLELEIEGLKKGLKPLHFCKLAGVNPSSWSRWKKGQMPLLNSIERIEKAIRVYEK